MVSSGHIAWGPIGFAVIFVVATFLWNWVTASDAFKERRYFDLFMYLVVAGFASFWVWAILSYLLP